LKTLCLPDNINISKLNFSLSLFSKCHPFILYCARVMYEAFYVQRRGGKKQFKISYAFLHFCGTEDF
jgi:hypothetical protein